MSVNNISESGFINNLTSAFSAEPFLEQFSRMGCRGIGDDCAVIKMDSSRAMVVTTDMLVEGVHFLSLAISARELGHKSLAVNLSDVAAMGARPFASFMSISLPKTLEKSWADEFIEGYKNLSAEHGVLLLGGDTVGGDKITINIVAMGQVDYSNIKYRTNAKVGDKLLITGSLGESAAGLKIILEQLENRENWSAEQRRLVDLHHRPTPQIEQGVWLGGQAAVSAMVDISDGLLNDIKHITKEFGAQIVSSQIPTSVDIATAISGGEDYQLLLSVEAAECERIKDEYLAHFGIPLYEIGHITEAKGIEWLGLDDKAKKELKTFSHF